ncbi:MAG: glycosyl hydrolase [Chloroflexota bacterium]
MHIARALLIALCALVAIESHAESKKDQAKDQSAESFNSSIISGMKFRNIGPAVISGRISDFAVNPRNKAVFYVGVACGSVWKTTNGGSSFTPIFDNYSSFSIGCLALDQGNPDILWVGTGENNSQRSVSYGDGVYKSTDGGASFKNMGLKKSEHIGKILIDPRNSNVVYVAAQGPLWGPGGDRGLYKTTDGGETWTQVLKISENTGVTDVVLDPRNPDILIAASYQRRRHVWTMIDGGPESAIHKSFDGGKTWTKLTNGLPSGDLGKIGLAIAPSNPDVVYATIEASPEEGGIYASSNLGSSWEKRNSWFSGSAQYYQELIVDPTNENNFYALDTYTRYSTDGGKTLSVLSNRHRHVDDHALWINPDNTKHILIGGDGGVYESFDKGSNWQWFTNLPVAQFYRISVDESAPFYWVFGGTQDNNSWGGPTRTNSVGGISNEEWIKLVGGDGYEAQVDPTDPNIIYTQYQYGSLFRYDKKSGELLYIQPQGATGEELRWNWDTPLLISPHSHTRIYIASNRLFRSDDRGDSWRAVSGDLTRKVDRNSLPVMGKIWSPDAVAKNASTSFFGNIISISESPKKEDLIYVGTDDGLIQVTEDGGKNWTKIDKFAGVPDMTYNSDIWASLHDENVVYATFDNHKMADFKPYVLKSVDKGRTWKSISSNLPENGAVYTITEDHVDPNLLFVGTEYGAFFSTDGGGKWIQFKSGLPTIAVRDLEIQRRENDLLLGTFGRGIYVLDDYTPLRNLKKETLDKEAYIFPVRDAWVYNEDESRYRDDHGELAFRADNPPFGATFTYYVKTAPKTLKQLRKDREREAEKAGKAIPYASMDSLYLEELEEKPQLIFRITDAKGGVVRTLTAPVAEGMNRITWDARYPSNYPVSDNTQINSASGYRAAPGQYFVTMFRYDGKDTKQMTEPQPFTIKLYNNTTIASADWNKNVEFYNEVNKFQLALTSWGSIMSDNMKKINLIEKAIDLTPNAPLELKSRARAIELELLSLNTMLHGNPTKAKRNENQPPTLDDRLNYLSWGIWSVSNEPTASQRQILATAKTEFDAFYSRARKVVETDVRSLEADLEKYGAPYTPGRLPAWGKP